MKDKSNNGKWLSLSIFIILSLGISLLTCIYNDTLKYILVLIFALGLVLIALKKPFFGYLLFIVAIPFEAAFVFEIGFTVRISYILICLLLYILFVKKSKFAFKGIPLNNLIGIYLAVVALSMMMAFVFPPPEVSLSETMKYRGMATRGIIQYLILLMFILSYYLTIHFCSSIDRLRIALKTYAVIYLIISLYGIYQVFAFYFNLPFAQITNALSTAGEGYGGPFINAAFIRSFATFQEPLTFGHYILSFLPLLITIYIYKVNIFKERSFGIKNSLIILISVIALSFTVSRGAWIALICGILVIILGSNIKYSYKILILPLIFMIAVTLVLLITPPEIDILRLDKATILYDPRRDNISDSFNFYLGNPKIWLLGVGIGNFGLHMAKNLGQSVLGGANFLFLQILLENGIIGLTVFIVLIIKYILFLVKKLKEFKNTSYYPYILGFLACFIAMMVQHISFGDRMALYVWVNMGITVASIKIFDKMSKQNIGALVNEK